MLVFTFAELDALMCILYLRTLTDVYLPLIATLNSRCYQNKLLFYSANIQQGSFTKKAKAACRANDT